jgi:hypothetical protein
VFRGLLRHADICTNRVLFFQVVSLELEEESKRSLGMEAEVEKYLRQLTKHREETNSMLLGNYSSIIDLDYPNLW